MKWAVIRCIGSYGVLFIRTAKCQIAAYRAAASESSRGVFWVVCSCGKWCVRFKRDIFTCRNVVYPWCSYERSGNT